MPFLLLLLLATVASAGTAPSSRPETFAFWYEPYQTLGRPEATLPKIQGASFVVSDGWQAPADLAARRMQRLPYFTLYNSYCWTPTITDKTSVSDALRWLGPVAFYHPSLRVPGSPPGMIPSDNSIPTAVNYNPNDICYTLCPNSLVLHQKVLRKIREEMTSGGAQGVFIDNGYSDSRVADKSCESPHHRHVLPGPVTSAQAYIALLQEVRDAVKAIRPDGLVLINGLVPPETTYNGLRLMDLVDGQLWESFLRTSLTSPKDHRAEWPFTHDLAIELEKRWLVKGRPHAYALSYPFDRAEAFFCYATAKLSNLPWAAGIGRNDPEHRVNGGGHFGTYPELLSIRLGDVTKTDEWGGTPLQSAFYRTYEKGFVVVNPTATVLRWTAPLPKGERYRDVWSGKKLGPGPIVLDLPAESGRVLLRER